MEDDKYKKAYDMVMHYEGQIHQKNQKRISIGLKCILVIPLIFLALLFWTNSSKVIFLILWIVSLFILAAYLIAVEYMDYNLMERMAKLNGEEQEMEGYQLIGNEVLENRIQEVLEKIESEEGMEGGNEKHH
ncbi:hypothetical protein [Roseburia sp. 499]|uniref:hypothetical protein n=1 Tax=Roseburia sp. 499 TaxID=1261634 RepID=UPI0009510105|nr:hypothetical protein [Roseburia sp. 499]WVK70668.1 hypothetical protein BIV20_03800 [Roseburia sp. 499]